MKENYDIFERLTRAGDLRVFTKALTEAGLKESLQNQGPYTIFAPTDQAFAKVPSAKLDELLKPENRETLQLLLRNHIVPGKLMSSELMRLDKTRTAKGEEVRIDSRDGLRINDAKILLPDLEASNGVLHEIDAVLMPQTQAASAA